MRRKRRTADNAVAIGLGIVGGVALAQWLGMKIDFECLSCVKNAEYRTMLKKIGVRRL